MSNLDYLSILSVAVPVYLTMATGAFSRRFGLLKPEADTSVMKLSVMVLTPALIMERVVGNPSVMKVLPVLVAAGLGFSLVLLGIVFTYLVAPLIGLKKGEGRRTFSVACGLQNYGFVAIPIVTALFPDKGTLGVLFTFTLGVEIACWTVGVGMLTGFDKAPWRLALNVPVLTIVTSLILNFTGLYVYVPQVAYNTFHMLGACAVPLAVLLIGASIADLWGHDSVRWKVALFSPVLRLGIIPLAFVLAAVCLPLSTELKRVIIVQGAMPSAVFNIMIARLYGGHAPTAVQVVIATTVVSCFTIPLFIAWGLKLAGV